MLGKYPGGDDWLGPSGDRCESDPKEWPVAYHGTLDKNTSGIVKDGFQLEKSRRFAFGRGIYCTPNPKAALHYATEYMFQASLFDFERFYSYNYYIIKSETKITFNFIYVKCEPRGLPYLF